MAKIDIAIRNFVLVGCIIVMTHVLARGIIQDRKETFHVDERDEIRKKQQDELLQFVMNNNNNGEEDAKKDFLEPGHKAYEDISAFNDFDDSSFYSAVNFSS